MPTGVYERKPSPESLNPTCKCGVSLTKDNWYTSNKKKGYYVCNPCLVARSTSYYKAQPWKHTELTRRRLLPNSKYVPIWSSKETVLPIYKDAYDKGLTVDHIVPINHPDVCGLHCEDNLQLLSLEENGRKGNNFGGKVR